MDLQAGLSGNFCQFEPGRLVCDATPECVQDVQLVARGNLAWCAVFRVLLLDGLCRRGRRGL